MKRWWRFWETQEWVIKISVLSRILNGISQLQLRSVWWNKPWRSTFFEAWSKVASFRHWYTISTQKKSLENTDIRILLNGERVNNIRYADETVTFTDSMNSIQKLMTRIVDSSSQQQQVRVRPQVTDTSFFHCFHDIIPPFTFGFSHWSSAAIFYLIL